MGFVFQDSRSLHAVIESISPFRGLHALVLIGRLRIHGKALASGFNRAASRSVLVAGPGSLGQISPRPPAPRWATGADARKPGRGWVHSKQRILRGRQ